MKRLLPVIIVVCLILALFCLLPTSEQNHNQPQSLSELDGCKVGIQTGLNYEFYLADVCPGAEPIFFSEYRSMFPALQQSKLDAILTESTSFVVEGKEHEGLMVIEEPVYEEECGIGVSNDGMGASLLTQLNDFIAECERDGTHEQMMDYWFDNYDRDLAEVDKSGITGENGIVNFASEAAYEPVCYIGVGGQLQGYDIDFIYRFCRKYGYEPEITPLEYDAMAAALASGKCKVAMGLIEDEERAEAVSFTEPYLFYDIIAVYYGGSVDNTPFIDRLKTSFSKTFIREDRWKLFLEGAATTLMISVLSVLFGSVLGLLLYVWVVNGKKAEANVMGILCWITGSTPTVVLLMILYYILFGNYVISNVAVAIVGFTFVFACNLYENILAGVKAVGTGQEEAARAQGFTANQTFFKIIFPQAVVHFAPSYKSDVISLILDTSVVGYIAIMDLTKMSDMIRARTYEAFFPLLATAVIYYLLIYIVTIVLDNLFYIDDNKNRKKEKIEKDIGVNIKS